MYSFLVRAKPHARRNALSQAGQTNWETLQGSNHEIMNALRINLNPPSILSYPTAPHTLGHLVPEPSDELHPTPEVVHAGLTMVTAHHTARQLLGQWIRVRDRTVPYEYTVASM